MRMRSSTLSRASLRISWIWWTRWRARAFRWRSGVIVVSSATITSRSAAAAKPSRPSTRNRRSAHPSLTSTSPTGNGNVAGREQGVADHRPGRAARAARSVGTAFGGSAEVSSMSSSTETATRSPRVGTVSRRSTFSSSRMSGLEDPHGALHVGGRHQEGPPERLADLEAGRVAGREPHSQDSSRRLHVGFQVGLRARGVGLREAVRWRLAARPATPRGPGSGTRAR